MEKKFKLLSVFLFSCVFTFFLSSCSNDDESSDKYIVNIATMNDLGSGKFDFTLDNSERLWVASSATSYKPTYKRVIINYTLLSDKVEGYDHVVHLNGYVADVLTKGVIYINPADVAKQDSIGKSRIKIVSVWEGGGYLNFHFAYNEGGAKAHFISLVSAVPDRSVNADIVKLEFRHNQNNDPEYRPAYGYASFDLSPYRKAGRNTVEFEISSKDFSGQTKTYKVEYKYKS